MRQIEKVFASENKNKPMKCDSGVGHFMIATALQCWWQKIFMVKNWSQIFQFGHQHIKLVANGDSDVVIIVMLAI